MTCVDLGLTIPSVPDFFLPNAGLNIQIPPGVDLPCCKFEIPIPGLDATLAAANAAIAGVIAAGGAPIQAAIMTANEVIAVAQTQLNKVRIRIPECPLDS